MLPDYVKTNREAWGRWAGPIFEEAGRRSWSTNEITWGIWDVPEASLGALGDLSEYRGRRVVELGCGTAYFSAWFAKLGAHPVGIDITPEQLANARKFQQEFGYSFPLIEGSAEELPFEDESFDVAFSEYGASIWCDPYKWIPEAARVLSPGGRLIFLRNASIFVLCCLNEGAALETLQRPLFGLNRLDWEDSVEFHIGHGAMMNLLKGEGFVLENLIEIQAPKEGRDIRFDFVTRDWAHRWPSEEIWCARKVR